MRTAPFLPLLAALLLAGLASAQDDERQGRTFVLVVGIDDYADTKIPKLKYAEADAQAVFRFYAQDPGSPTTSDRVKVLLGKEATQRQLLRAIEEHLVRQATRPEDTAVLYFAGHGFADAQTTYLAGQDTELDYLGWSAISHHQLQALWNKLRARTRILIADACHSGGFGGLRGGPGGFGKRVGKDLPASLRSLVIASAGENELAAEDRRAGRGVFSAALVAGLRGAADRNKDGTVSAQELAAYLEDEVPSRAAAVGGKQTPEVVLSPGSESLRLSTPSRSGPRPVAGDEHAARLEAERKAAEAERERAELQKAVAEQKAQASARAQAAAEARVKELEAQRGASAEELARARAEAKRLAGEAGQAQAALAKAKELEAQRRAAEDRAKEEERRRLAAEKRKAEVEQENARLRAELLALKGKQEEAAQARREAEAAKARSEALEEQKRALEGGGPSSSPASGGYAAAVEQAKRLSGFLYLDTKAYACGGQRFEVARFRHERTGLVFHLVPGGSFQREAGSRVAVRPFLISATETTQAAWEKVMGDNPSGFKGPNRPVENVSWNDAQGFCQKAGLRLPSEAEWEYACRAGTQSAYCFGEGEGELGRYAEYEGNNNKETKDVGGKLPNAFGLFDVHGNVWEWCQDGWHDNYQGAPRDGSAWDSAGASDRVRRGGSWYDGAWGCRSADRRRCGPGLRFRNLGFRPARSLP
ncbi:MAG: SUMF1/EgtB/PvdO family nonheme iron enzyme [Planctomycetota bacterium]